jgi:hypothetical protein
VCCFARVAVVLLAVDTEWIPEEALMAERDQHEFTVKIAGSGWGPTAGAAAIRDALVAALPAGTEISVSGAVGVVSGTAK